MSKKKNDIGLNAQEVFDDPDVSDLDVSDEDRSDTSDNKDYTVLIDGAIINGKLCNHGDVVSLHPDVAKAHTDADVRLSEVKAA